MSEWLLTDWRTGEVEELPVPECPLVYVDVEKEQERKGERHDNGTDVEE